MGKQLVLVGRERRDLNFLWEFPVFFHFSYAFTLHSHTERELIRSGIEICCRVSKKKKVKVRKRMGEKEDPCEWRRENTHLVVFRGRETLLEQISIHRRIQLTNAFSKLERAHKATGFSARHRSTTTFRGRRLEHCARANWWMLTATHMHAALDLPVSTAHALPYCRQLLQSPSIWLLCSSLSSSLFSTPFPSSSQSLPSLKVILFLCFHSLIWKPESVQVVSLCFQKKKQIFTLTREP